MTPITDDPYLYGKITTCNATNDNFAMNATDILTYLIFMALPTDIPETFPKRMLEGVRDFLKSIDSEISGGHTTYSEWPFLGGLTNSIMKTEDITRKPAENLKLGDKIILTKPLGTQGIMAAYRLLADDDAIGILDEFNKNEIESAIKSCEISMTTSLRPVPLAIHEYKLKQYIRSMTDITGFGLQGHLGECLENSPFAAKIHSLPVFPLSIELSDLLGFNLRQGKSAETAGSMCIIVDSTAYKDFMDALHAFNVQTYEIGEIIEKRESLIELDAGLQYMIINRFGQ